MGEEKLGDKYIVTRRDGRDGPGGDREGLTPFVCCYERDVYAWAAAACWAICAAVERFHLARELARNLLSAYPSCRDLPGNAARFREVFDGPCDQSQPFAILIKLSCSVAPPDPPPPAAALHATPSQPAPARAAGSGPPPVAQRRAG